MVELSSWDRDQVARERLEDKIINNTYLCRPLIEMDTPVLGGVSIGAKQREAIVVDTKYGELNKLYDIAKKKATVGNNLWKQLILDSVYETVKEAMPEQCDEPLEGLLKKHGINKDVKITLDEFIKRKTGNCIHDALACAALLEMFKEEGLIRGKISVDKNTINHLGEHAWCRYTNLGNEVYILDVRREYTGPLKGSTKWPYERPGESR
ncbi:MAG: hypothetical protein KKB39_01420 [Nanoarchaeota archaeon]|nr:hypothetical protein [Nanoarchaeota archaeon]